MTPFSILPASHSYVSRAMPCMLPLMPRARLWTPPYQPVACKRGIRRSSATSVSLYRLLCVSPLACRPHHPYTLLSPGKPQSWPALLPRTISACLKQRNIALVPHDALELTSRSPRRVSRTRAQRNAVPQSYPTALVCSSCSEPSTLSRLSGPKGTQGCLPIFGRAHLPARSPLDRPRRPLTNQR